MRVLGVEVTVAQVLVIVGLRGGGYMVGKKKSKKKKWKEPRTHQFWLQR